MGARLIRRVAGIVSAAILVCLAPGAAYAGTLTGASFSTSTAYTYTSAQNTRYDWGFTTATTGTLSKVIMAVPAGTGGANRYLALSGATNANFASTPDSGTNSIVGDIDIRAKVAMANWVPSAGQYPDLVAKANSSKAYQLVVLPTSGDLMLQTSSNGSSWTTLCVNLDLDTL